ncbi:hypothetical protein EC991_008415 [Linnemannia zychae]|nr:hypothetical protein EC991_008415 [Linnemannia zychae]
MQMAATDGFSFEPIGDRRGGPMDAGEPMQDNQQQQQQQPSMILSSPAGNGTLQPEQYDPRLLMHPLQPQISNQSTQSNQSFQSFESYESQQQQNAGGGFSGHGTTPFQQQQQQQQQPQQYHFQQQQQPFSNPPQATTSSSLTSASGHLAPPSHHGHEKSKSRRWSITGRFFEKRKSITEPFHVPGAPPSSAFSSSYKSTNSNIVGTEMGANGKGSSWGGPESNFGGRGSGNGGNGDQNTNGSHRHHHHHGHHNQQANNNNNGSSSNAASNNNGSSGTDSKNNSPPGSNGSSRRSSISDLPKAILSSFRRSSLVGPGDTHNALAAASGTSMAGSGAGGGDGAIAEEGEELDEGKGPKVLMAVPKAPPQDPHTSRPPPKSILKKRPSETNPAAATAAAGANTGATTGDAAAVSASTAAAAAGANATANATGGVGLDRTMSSDTVHPMATADMDIKDINLLAPSDHRARLLTHSPTPTHPQQHLVNNNDDVNSALIGGAGSPLPTNNSDSVTNSNNGSLDKMQSSLSSQGAALPPDFTPGVQSNSYKDRGGERGQGSVQDYMSQDEMLTLQMVGISSRAQDLANQYYGTSSQNSQTARPSAPIASAAAAAGAGGRRRSINFLETVEIIPAHRKADYNRQSDKHATFKILTPDMKSEIRDELNTYKMREMAVHVESMGNTAFH